MALICSNVTEATVVDLSIEPATKTVLLGDTFEMELWATSSPSGQGIKGITATIEWDTAKLQFLGYTDEIGGMWTDFITYPGLGQATIDGAMLMFAVPTDVLVYTLQFDALDVTNSTLLEFASASVRDSENQDITGNLSSADITITPEPATIGLLGLGALSLLKRRRA